MVVEGMTAPDFSAVSRLQLIQWLNFEFELSVTKVEQCGTGAVYMQVIDKLLWSAQYSGESAPIPMQRIRWDTENAIDFADNYKLLQKVFQRFNIKKNIPVQDLSKLRMQDNLAFLQFLHSLYLKYYSGDDNTYPGGWARRETSTHGNFKPWALPSFDNSACDTAERQPVQQKRKPVPKSHHVGGPARADHATRGFKANPTVGIAQSKQSASRGGGATQNIGGARPYQQQNGQLDALKDRISELETIIADADIDINLLNVERAKYYTQLLSIEKLRLIRENRHGANAPCISPNEILACIDAVNLPADVKPFAAEFDYRLYVLNNDEQDPPGVLNDENLGLSTSDVERDATLCRGKYAPSTIEEEPESDGGSVHSVTNRRPSQQPPVFVGGVDMRPVYEPRRISNGYDHVPQG